MSVYNNQTNASPGDAFFAPIGGGGGGTPSNWSLYPALSTITYSGEGGIANFAEVYALSGISTPYIIADQITSLQMAAAVFQTSTINGSPYSASSPPIFGTFAFNEGDSGATVTATGCTPESVVLITQHGSDTSNPIQTIDARTNAFYVLLSSPAPAGYYLNWVAFTNR